MAGIFRGALKYLLNESKKYSDFCIPNDTEEQKTLSRSLVNVREPKEVSEDFIKIQDEYLRHEIEAKGITDCESLPFSESKISLWQGDITTLKCSAIVNAANSAMRTMHSLWLMKLKRVITFVSVLGL